MNCAEVQTRLPAYVDGELAASEFAEVEGHCLECRQCTDLVGAEREFRLLLRRQPREVAPAQLRARILRRIRHEAIVTKGRRWLPASAIGVAAAILVAVLLPARTPPLVADLVDKHIAYAQIERPAELASADAREVAEWFRSRAGLRVTVPDYSPSGIHLTGARLAEAHERKVAYLLYEKGRTLLSVFMVPVPASEGTLRGDRVRYRGQEYVTFERKGFRTVSWTDGQAVYGLVSGLDYEALLECADRLRPRLERREDRMTHSLRLMMLAVLLTAPWLAPSSRAADLDALMQEFRVTPTGLGPAPGFSLKPLDGKPLALADQRGRAVMLYFWATW